MRRLYEFGARYIDYRIAWVSAAFLGTIVFAINASHGAGPALTAALKQATYTFFFGGFIMRTCERLSVAWERPQIAYPAALLIPAAMAIGFTFALHSLKGTPDPLGSTLPTMLIAPPSFIFWARRKRAAHGVSGAGATGDAAGSSSPAS